MQTRIIVSAWISCIASLSVCANTPQIQLLKISHPTVHAAPMKRSANKRPNKNHSKPIPPSRPQMQNSMASKPAQAAPNATDKLIPASLLTQPAEHYVLQLMATKNEARAKLLINQTALQGQAFYYESHRRGTPWFVVLFGDFQSRTAAQNAITNLPERLQELNPWVRAVGAVQHELLVSETIN